MFENRRNWLIDFFRGLVILDMILVHFNIYFPSIIAKFLSYTDFAIEGFIFLFGFMIGSHYYAKFTFDKKAVIRRLLRRALQILTVQYFMILTISLPLAVVLGNTVTKGESIEVFLVKSFLLLNQVGLLHILPTFIPLLLLAIPILYMLERGYDVPVLMMSIIFFAIGNFYPYVFTLGDKTIFPVILWQIYFVAGCLLGKEAYLKGKICPNNINTYFGISLFILFVTLIIKHAKVISPHLTEKYPLNALGLLYGSSIIFVIYTSIIKYWETLFGKIKVFNSFLPLLGQHSLLTFVLHVYTAKAIYVFNFMFDLGSIVNCLLILISVVGIYLIVSKYDSIENNRQKNLAMNSSYI